MINAFRSMRRWLGYISAILLLAIDTLGQHVSTSSQRNIIFILVDDMRFDAMGFKNPYFTTPNLDALAQGGIVFENAFVTTSLCSPSRASILSGQYGHVHGVLDNSTPFPSHIPTFPSELQKLNYQTAFVGKWHMGGDSDAPRPGFNQWVSFKGQGVYINPTLNVDGNRIPTLGYVTDIITDYATQFIREAHEKPFMLYVSHKAVHAEFACADRHRGSYQKRMYPFPDSMKDTDKNYAGKPEWVRRQRQSWHGVEGLYNNTTDMDLFTRDYAETLRAVDDGVGQIVEALREKGLLESTLIVFTSDNGFQFGEHGLIDKRTMYEASIRVPMIVHCPELFAGGVSRKEMILNVDIAPTLIEAAGGAIPATVQGRSFMSLLNGNPASGQESEWRDAFLYEYFWERSFPQTPTVLGVRTDRYKFMKFQGIWDRYELYDLQEDPNEMKNLLGDYLIKNQAGELDQLIRARAPAELKKLFSQMQQALNKQLQETNCAPEPRWSLP